MKSVYFITGVVLLITGCNNAESADKVKKSDNTVSVKNQDSIALTKLVRQAYKWHEEKANTLDFDVKTNNPADTLYAGINWDAHNKLVKAIKESKYFDQHFIENYQKIAEYIDAQLKTGKMIYLVGELPPFGNDANPWCNCQDNPDNFWNILKIIDLKVVNNTAIFSWTWGDGFRYNTKAVKQNGGWKISYLEGFDSENFK
jgi:hypothetical protein